eukprot:CAMPEP_0173391854 /NCGR_PEP_ID=MMETSP1356-20130122/18625_1 /TAXON_ID=77927 ORGANISM="Hemiselmis virescens, Strain PCC157" /NCGR_SAMPLE_ID=MMETSP1356 /ASSEMBLY_ACC=CAM_ASM_000847 /LENGTH=62 /DNA_ID=CAMNT_0014349547 /DNA_START=177 /DNA_END=365 /DNA_ORIENTATION=+
MEHASPPTQASCGTPAERRPAVVLPRRKVSVATSLRSTASLGLAFAGETSTTRASSSSTPKV